MSTRSLSGVTRREIRSWLMDMDGVLVHEEEALPGADRFIATNPDNTGPSPDGLVPATGSVAALVSRATGVQPYYVGKPNPLMMRSNE
jgi:ribonucleotide monophosphatase NagD (HAD superfamily)